MEQARFHYDNLFYVSPCSRQLSICQIGDLSCGPQNTVGEHNQDCYELSLILSGDAVFRISGEAVRVRAGDLVLNRPGDIHLIESDDADPVRYLYVGFSFRDESYTAVRRAFDAASVRVTADCGELAVLFFSIFSELEQDSEYRLSMIAAYLTELVVKSYRRFLGQKSRRYAPSFPRVRQRTLCTPLSAGWILPNCGSNTCPGSATISATAIPICPSCSPGGWGCRSRSISRCACSAGRSPCWKAASA